MKIYRVIINLKQEIVMRKSCVLILLIFTVISNWQSLAAGTEWNLAMDKEGIQIFTRDAEGCPLNEFKGVTSINASMKTILRVLKDVNNQADWMSGCLQSKLLKTINADHLVVYNLLHIGWPLSDRDMLIEVKFIENKKEKKLLVDMGVCSEDIFPVNSKHVRIRDFKAMVVVEEVSPDQCRVVYQNRVNPMAPVPAFLANMVVKKNPFETLQGMKKMVLLEKYQATGK